MSGSTFDSFRPWRGNFFPAMSVVITATVAAGFIFNAIVTHVDFYNLPLLVHVHAVLSAGWLLFFILQTALVRSGSVALHRRLGWFGAIWATAIIPLGLATAVFAVHRGAILPFLPASVFLVMNIMEILVFSGLTGAAVAMRARSGWHKRLMLCGTIMLMSAGVGRLVPLPLLGLWSPVGILLGLMVFIGMGMIFDLKTRRSIHPAYYWGAGAIILAQLLIVPIALTPAVTSLTARIAARASA